MKNYIAIGDDELKEITATAKKGDLIEIEIDGATYICPLKYGKTYLPDGKSHETPTLGYVMIPDGRLFLVTIAGKITHPNAKNYGGTNEV